MTDYLTTHFVPALLITTFTASCSVILDERKTQCVVNADCAHFEGNPSCQQGVCVATGLGPPGCFPEEPSTPEQLANHCTTASRVQFDNCNRLNLCDDTAVATAFQRSTTPGVLGTVPPSGVNQVTKGPCTNAPGKVIYVTGSTNLPPLLKAVQPLLSANDPPYTVVFAPQTSCKGAASMYDSDRTKNVITDIENNYAFYYDPGDPKGEPVYCNLAPGGNAVDVGESDVYPSSCGYTPSPTDGIADYPGPILAISFVVPSASTQFAISAEAAHLVFGAGGDSGRAFPWTEPHRYFVRSSGTGTVQLPSRSINVNPSAWWGIDRLSAANLVLAMVTLNPIFVEEAIGILSSDFADRNRDNLRVLAFQQSGQKYAYLPDSTSEAFDKSNVRDGHYPIWGAIHLIAATTNGSPSEAASALIAQLTAPRLEPSVVSAIIDAGFVPPCAMKVTHTSEVGPLKPLLPKSACGCLFDKKTNGATSCKECSGPADCPTSAPACSYGYCENQ